MRMKIFTRPLWIRLMNQLIILITKPWGVPWEGTQVCTVWAPWHPWGSLRTPSIYPQGIMRTPNLTATLFIQRMIHILEKDSKNSVRPNCENFDILNELHSIYETNKWRIELLETMYLKGTLNCHISQTWKNVWFLFRNKRLQVLEIDVLYCTVQEIVFEKLKTFIQLEWYSIH